MASYFCPCPRGMEAALAEELGEIAQDSSTMKVHNQVPGGVHCSGDLLDPTASTCIRVSLRAC